MEFFWIQVPSAKEFGNETNETIQAAESLVIRIDKEQSDQTCAIDATSLIDIVASMCPTGSISSMFFIKKK